MAGNHEPTTSAPATVQQEATVLLKSLSTAILSNESLRKLLTDLLLALKDSLTLVVAEVHNVDADNFSRAQLVQDTPDTSNNVDDVLQRLSAVLVQIQQTPRYRSSVLSLFQLVQSQTVLFSSSPVPPPHLTVSPYLRPAIEPFTGDLTPFLRSLTSLRSAVEEPSHELTAVIVEVETFVTAIALEPLWVQRDEGRRQFEALISHMHIPSLTPVRNAFTHFFGELHHVLIRLEEDADLIALARALSSLGLACEQWTATFTKQLSGRSALSDVLDWVLPRLLTLMDNVPLPRLEFENPGLGIQVALDVPSFIALDLLPCPITIHESSTLIFPSSALTPNSTRFRILLEGIRLTIRDIGYFARWTKLCGLSDHGLLDFEIGETLKSSSDNDSTKRGGLEGLKIEAEVEARAETPRSTGSNNGERRQLFSIISTNVTIPRLVISIHGSSSYRLSSLILAPVMSFVIKRELSGLIRAKIEAGLEAISVFGGNVVDEHKRIVDGTDDNKTTVHVWNWLEVVCIVGKQVWDAHQGASYKEGDDQDDEMEEGEVEVEAEEHNDNDTTTDSRIQVSGKGITVGLSVGSVGIGSSNIILPDGMGSTPASRPSLSEVKASLTPGAAADIGEHARVVRSTVSQVGDAIGTFEDELATERKTMKKSKWRSRAFDWK